MNKNKRRIAFLTTGSIKAIATMKRALGMANPLNELGWDVLIIAEDDSENRKRIELECNGNIQIFYYKKGNFVNEIKQKTTLVELIKPDIVYFCSFSIRNFFLKNRLSFTPEIIVEYSEMSSKIGDASWYRKCYMRFMEKYSVRYANRIVAASKYLYHYYSDRKINKRNIPVEYSPYAYNDQVLISDNQSYTNELYDRYKNHVVFIYMGSFVKNYGFYTMLESVKLLKQGGNKNFKFLFMGKGVELENGIKFVDTYGIGDEVEFLGYVDEDKLSSYFSIANAFVSPLNNTIQDIARCPSKIYMYLPFKKPIITSKIGEPHEIFKEEGLYFDVNKPSSLSVLLESVIKNQTKYCPINEDDHTWQTRARHFDSWVKSI